MYETTRWLAAQVGAEVLEIPGLHGGYLSHPAESAEILRPLLYKLEPGARGGLMIYAEGTIVINRPVEDVFEFEGNPSNDPRWIDDLVDSTPASGAAVGPGSTFRWKSNVMGKRQGELEITKLEPNRLEEIKIRSGNLPMRATFTHLFEEVNRATRFTRPVVSEPQGFFRIMRPMLPAVIAKNNMRFLENLKTVLEGESATRVSEHRER